MQRAWVRSRPVRSPLPCPGPIWATRPSHPPPPAESHSQTAFGLRRLAGVVVVRSCLLLAVQSTGMLQVDVAVSGGCDIMDVRLSHCRCKIKQSTDDGIYGGDNDWRQKYLEIPA